MAYTQGLGPCGRKTVGVQLPSPAQTMKIENSESSFEKFRTKKQREGRNVAKVLKNNPFEGQDTYARGRANEERAFGLLESLVIDGFFLRVGKASKKQNTKQRIDFLGYLPDETRIPIQVKSSFAARALYKRDYGDESVVIVVNPSWSDEALKRVLIADVSKYKIRMEPTR